MKSRRKISNIRDNIGFQLRSNYNQRQEVTPERRNHGFAATVGGRNKIPRQGSLLTISLLGAAALTSDG